MQNEAYINKLEEKIAWLESEHEKYIETIGTLFQKIDKLELEILRLKHIQKEISAVRDQKDEVPPPHY